MREYRYAGERPDRPGVYRLGDPGAPGGRHVPWAVRVSVCETGQGGRVDRSRRGRGPLTPTGHHAMMLFGHGMCRRSGAAHIGARRTTPRALGSTR